MKKAVVSMLAVLILAGVAIAQTGSAQITLENWSAAGSLWFVVDNDTEHACSANPDGGTCTLTVSSGMHHFAVQQGSTVLRSSDHEVVAGQNDTWVICSDANASHCPN